MKQFTEDNLVEQPAIKLFQELGFEYQNHYQEKFGSEEERNEINDVVLVRQLRESLAKLNPNVSAEAIELAIEELTKSRANLDLVQANKEVYDLIKNGVKAEVTGENGDREIERVKVIDFENPENNHFYLASQLWVAGDMYKRRADLVGFVNGLPLIFVELKSSHKNLKNAFDDNLRDYKNTIPQLFWYNSFIILSNGIDSKIGTITSQWEHFNEWKRINKEGEKGIVSMETIIKGTCNKSIFLDLLENFVLFDDSRGKTAKIVARNHQYLGVNGSIESFKKAKNNGGKIGVFWHTQGSGKSLSMVFFAQKILRKFEGNYTFLVVTDRRELDDQIYKQFQDVGAVTEKQVQAESGNHLQELLQEDHRLIFTLIQKFRTDKGKKYPELSSRNDIIVMTDEAHRSQYEVFALNMRNALPKAQFIGFTGTPLIAGESEKTKDVFGGYVSVYNFKQSIDDKATVPLYYENRIPELQLKNEDLGDDLEQLIEEAELDEAQEKKLEREFARQYHLITREDRLEKVAEDIVNHFFGRGDNGKAMVVSIDKATTVKMYDKVKKYLAKYIENLEGKLKGAKDEEWDEIVSKLKEAKALDMVVIVSSEQNEIENFHEKGLEIEHHRRRMVNEDLEKKFKDENDPFRLVFVCNMWLTGFDVPSLSTIYLDKPMKNHSLMQAIARANRVFENKNNGLIVDYVGVFRSLQKALSIYAADRGGDLTDENSPIHSKEELVEQLEEALAESKQFCDDLSISIESIRKAPELEKLKLISDAVNSILATEEKKKHYLTLTSTVSRLFRAILPDKHATSYLPQVSALKVIQARILALLPPTDIEEIGREIEKLLDESIETEGYNIRSLATVDLSQIDFEKLREQFEKDQKNIINEALKTKIGDKLKKMIKINPARMKFMEKFQALLDEYNSGAMTTEAFFDKLVAFTKELNEEEQRHMEENLSDEELALFDILRKPNLTDKEVKQVKKAAKALLESLKWEKLVMDWKKTQQRRASVMITVRDTLDKELPRSYEVKVYEAKCNEAYRHLYDNYEGNGKSAYEQLNTIAA
ncbi:type I restriction endonuclease subunit R [Patescibacteria group bacterium]|nr:type I restriction endonuclease subunit R [Patescibacteria group bacterium]